MRLFLLLFLIIPTTTFAAPRLRICTGQAGNAYHQAGTHLAQALGASVNVEVIATRGSWENLDAIDAQPRRCDAVIAQEDAYALFQYERPKSNLTMDRLATLYEEQVYLLCNRQANIKRLEDLDPKKHTVIINQYGSGTYVTWQLFGKLRPATAKVFSKELAVDPALLEVVKGETAQCMVFVSGPTAATLKRADTSYGKELMFVEIADPALHRKVGRDRRQVYRDSVIEKGRFKALAADDVATQSVGAVFFVSPEWMARYPDAAKALKAALPALITKLKH